MYTKKQMFNKEISYHDFMAQFVTEGMKQHVLRVVGLEKLQASEDEHLNDIPLHIWDGMVYVMKQEIAMNAKLWRNYKHPESKTFLGGNWNKQNPKGFLFSQSEGVSLAKTAARILIKENTVNHD